MIHVLLIKLILDISLIIGEVTYLYKWAFPVGMTCDHLARVKVGYTYEIKAPIDRTWCVFSACDKFIVKMKVVAWRRNLQFRMALV